MRLRAAWQRSGQVLEEESDERTELIGLRVLRTVTLTVAMLTLPCVVLLVTLPLSGRERSIGIGLLPVVLVVAGAAALAVAARIHGTFSRQLRQAILFRQLLWWPLAAIAVGLVAFGWHRNLAGAGVITAALLAGGLAGMLTRSWGLSRKSWREFDRWREGGGPPER